MSSEVGSKLQGKVTGITHFGAFIELPGGSTGLVHISEVADSYVKDINDYLTVGDEVTVKVLNVESDGKIGLSIRKAKEQPVRQQSHRQNRMNDQRWARACNSLSSASGTVMPSASALACASKRRVPGRRVPWSASIAAIRASRRA